jgi:hypothetical protein
MDIITRLVVETVRTNVDGSATTAADEAAERKLKSLLWLTYDTDHWLEAILQANYIVRQFVLGDDIEHAHRAVFEIIPEDLFPTLNRAASATDLQEYEVMALREFQCWQLFLSAMQKHKKWKQASSETTLGVVSSSSTGPVVSTGRFAEAYCEDAAAAFREVVSYSDGWLKDVGSSGIWTEHSTMGTERFEQQNRLRVKCLPSILFLWLNMLREMGRHRDALALINYATEDPHGSGLPNLLTHGQKIALMLEFKEISIDSWFGGQPR